jgi:cystathionine beta-lyase family protein involved in aluminum resistance
LSITGQPYDTLSATISGKDCGSLTDNGVRFEVVELRSGDFDIATIEARIKQLHPKVVYIQRSRGYQWRSALSVPAIDEVAAFVKSISDAVIFVDNCYGEFVEAAEPTVDLCMGSLIKNIGGGLCPTGGYIVGKRDIVDRIANRLTAPGIGMEVGSYAYGYQYFFQGLFMAPHAVAQALKTATLFSSVLKQLGYDVKPTAEEQFFDIVCSVKFDDRDKLIKFVQSIQRTAPIDSHVTLMPWDMPGYTDQVIMSAGCFVQGASIELSCDAPVKPPYIAYFQGALTLEHGILAIESAVKALLEQ